MNIDFAAIEARVTYRQVVDLLGLELTPSQDRDNEYRGPCPKCKRHGRRDLVITEGQGFYCWADQTGGRQIGLVAHVLGLRLRDAAAWILEHVDDTTEPGITNPPKTEKETSDDSSDRSPLHSDRSPLHKVADRLIHDHEKVVELGIDPEFAETIGVGFDKRGYMRGRVCIPLRTADGVLVGYVGVKHGDLKWPPRQGGDHGDE